MQSRQRGLIYINKKKSNKVLRTTKFTRGISHSEKKYLLLSPASSIYPVHRWAKNNNMMTNSSSEIKGLERKNSFLIRGMAVIFGHGSFWLIFSKKLGINNYTFIERE